MNLQLLATGRLPTQSHHPLYQHDHLPIAHRQAAIHTVPSGRVRDIGYSVGYLMLLKYAGTHYAKRGLLTMKLGWNQGDGNQLEDENPAISDDDGDDTDQQRILKQVNFPPEVERGDVNPISLVAKVSRAISKRLSKLQAHKEKIEEITQKTEVQRKTL